MSARLIQLMLVALISLSAVACDRSADKQRQEEAINRGEVPTAVAEATANNAFKGDCERAGGNWLADTSQCAMTSAMCQPPGEWDEANGCVFSEIPRDECEDMQSQGMQFVGEVCVIKNISSDQFEQLGLGGEN